MKIFITGGQGFIAKNLIEFYHEHDLFEYQRDSIVQNDLKKFNVQKESTFITDSNFNCNKKIDVDSSSENLKPSIENYIKRMLLVSDNFSYSRVFDFFTIS